MPSPNAKKYQWTDEDKRLAANTAYGESTTDSDLQLLALATMINRERSSKDREFGATPIEVLDKGYYAKINKNTPYREALAGKHPESIARIRAMLDDLLKQKKTGNVQFYFTPEEEEKLIKRNGFNFNAVKALGQMGPYNLYGY